MLDEVDASLAALDAVGGQVLFRGEDDYPGTLEELHEPPPFLYALGDLSMLRPPIVAMVGTRNATAYGERATREVAGALARAGACVISGLARGIDAAAHRAALDAGGRTIAVLGTGVDVSYPAAHRALQQTIAERGLLLSEWPPAEKANGGAFVQRNRIIAALAQLTIVVEAPEKSGALHTSAFAQELNRDVAIVPGPIDAPQSMGSNLLLRDGAQLILCAADALALVKLEAPIRCHTDSLTPPELAVWEALASGTLDADTLASRSRLPARECLAAVTTLEIMGFVECDLTGAIRRRG